MDIGPDDLEDLKMKVQELQGDLKHLGYELTDVGDFLKETRALAPAEQTPKLRKQIERMQKWMDSIQEN